jgi:hypothetical protein
MMVHQVVGEIDIKVPLLEKSAEHHRKIGWFHNTNAILVESVSIHTDYSATVFAKSRKDGGGESKHAQESADGSTFRHRPWELRTNSMPSPTTAWPVGFEP